MRSSKSRSRSKSNRPRSLGNIVNRVFDSSGPEGKVRGTPQQIIDKYLVLARDAQLSNDRVAAENFLQHAEHYTRMLQEAQREMAREAESRRDGGGSFGGPHQGSPAGERDPRGDGRHDGRNEGRSDARNDARNDGRIDTRDDSRGEARGGDQRGRGPEGRSNGRGPEPAAAAVIDFSDDSGGHLVETPEMRESLGDTPGEVAAPDTAATAPEPAAEAEDGQAPRRRAPRRPRSGTRKAEPAEAKSSAAE